MLNILLADDDILTLNKLHHILDSRMSDFIVIGQSLDGVDALEKIKQFSPDLVILDMDMPKANGIDVAEVIALEQLPTKILALSNYDNFEYVKPIMQLGALDYVLKHELSTKLLFDKLRKIQKLLYQQKENSQNFLFLSSIAKQTALRKLILDDRENLLPEYFVKQQKEFSGKSNVLICIQIINFIILYSKDTDHNHEKIIQSILDICSNILTTLENGVITYTEDGEFAILLNMDRYSSRKDFSSHVHQVIQLLQNNLSKMLNLHILTRVTQFSGGLQQVRSSYLLAHNELCQKPFAKHANVLPQSSSYQLSLADEKNLVDALYLFDKHRCITVLNRIFEPLLMEETSSRTVELAIIQLLNIANRFLESLQYTQVTPENPFPTWLTAHHTNESLLTHLAEFYCDVLDSIPAQLPISHSVVIHSAVNYIHDHYYDDVSLHSVAAHCNISEVYLSKLFKSEMNISFVNYLNNYRISIAKELLKNSNKAIKDIYEEVGFRNYNYFIKVFKDITGMTPMGYEKSMNQKIE